MNKTHYTKTRGAYLLVLFLFITHIFTTSFSSAPPIGRTGAPGESSCTGCHGGYNPQGLDGSITISGLPAEVLPNTNYRVTVEVANPNGLSLNAGMQMVALNSQDQNAGSFSNQSMGANVIVAGNGRNYLGHSPAQVYDANRVATWSVDWMSPADPDPSVTFYAVGNITDMDANSNTANDLILFETVDVAVADEVVVELPDLTAGNIVGFEGMFAQDEVVEFSWDLINLGQGIAADNYRIVMYLSEDQVFSPDDVAVGEVPTGNTFPGTISAVPGAITIPSNQLEGDYYLHFFVDNDNDIEESDETNNIITSSTTITVGVEVLDPIEVNILSVLDCEGAVTLESTVIGGVGSYIYNWNTGETTPNITVTDSGDYTVNIMDEAGDEATATLSVIVPEILEVTSMINQQPGAGQLGDISILITGGALPYDINWSNGDTGTQNDNLPAGNYVIMVTDANGCTASVQVLLVEETVALTVEADLTQLTCSDSDDASISLMTNVSATYAWSTGATTAEIMDLSAGMYSVTVTSNEDVVIRSFTITQINPIDLVTQVQSVTCFGDMDGQINVLTTGGTGPYTYAWSNGSTTNNIANLDGGDYTLTVTDANGCEHIADFEIEEPAELTLELAVMDVLCPNGDDGSIMINQLTGGTPPYSFSWSTGTTTNALNNLVAGSYTLTVADANECVVERSVMVSAPAEIVLSLESFTTADGEVCLDAGVVGGTAPFTYLWSNGATTQEICDLEPGAYSVTITDSNGCETMGTGEVLSTGISGIAELNQWELYPTLAEDILQVEVQLDQSINLSVQLASLDGRYVEVPIAAFSQIGLYQNARLDISSLDSGIYLLILSTDQGREVKRFVKM